MRYVIVIQHGAYSYQFQVEQSKPSKGFELFTLTGGGRKVVLQCNRHMLLYRGLKKKPVYWKVVEGEVKDFKALSKVTLAIEQYLKEREMQKKPSVSLKKEVNSTPVYAKSRRQQAQDVPPIPWNIRRKD